MKIEVVKEVKNENGTTTYTVDIDDEFRDWFLRTEGLKRLSRKRFEKWFNQALQEYLSQHSAGPVDLGE